MINLNPDFLYMKLHMQQSDSDSFEPISSFKFEGDLYETEPAKQSPKQGRVKVLICKHCGHRDFNDDGRFINEYSCNGCDRFIEVTFKQG